MKKAFKYDYKKSAREMKDNSLNIESMGRFEELPNSVTGTGIMDLDIITIYLPSIIENGQAISVSRQAESAYRYNPKKLSLDTYGVPDFWYLILAMNGYNSIYDFKGFSLLIVPDDKYVSDLVTRLEKENK